MVHSYDSYEVVLRMMDYLIISWKQHFGFMNNVFPLKEGVSILTRKPNNYRNFHWIFFYQGQLLEQGRLLSTVPGSNVSQLQRVLSERFSYLTLTWYDNLFSHSWPVAGAETLPHYSLSEAVAGRN